MNNRKYHTDPGELLEQGKAIMSSSDESKFHFKVFAVNMVLAGTSASDVGRSAGVSKVTVTSWVKTADEQGFEALRVKKQSGRPSKLSAEQLQEIDAALSQDASEFGYKIWDGPALSDFILDKYGVVLSVRQCQRLFHELGYSLIRPQSFPSKGYEDTEARTAFKKNSGISKQ
ncbi:MAG: transposase [Eubacteriaceae bacterium]|nr:transposase [Eubacteriaceae bacterium]